MTRGAFREAAANTRRTSDTHFFKIHCSVWE